MFGGEVDDFVIYTGHLGTY